MTRVIWIATTCFAVVSTLAVGKAMMAHTPSPAAERQMDTAVTDSGLIQNALAKADRLEVIYVRQEGPTVSALQPSEPVAPTAESAPPLHDLVRFATRKGDRT